MEQIDRVRARTDALQVLGLDHSATANDIRDAWRKIAFHGHPDHKSGDCSEFSEAKTAYDFLRKEGLTHKAPETAPSPRRPRLKKRVIDIAADDIEACRTLLDPDLALSDDTGKTTTPKKGNCSRDSDHIPEAIGCFGRNLTYFVPTPVCEGPNRVALPTTVLASDRRSEAEILSFQSKSAGSGEIVVPDAIRARRFPGAKSVKIRFDADQFVRDEFWLAS